LSHSDRDPSAKATPQGRPIASYSLFAGHLPGINGQMLYPNLPGIRFTEKTQRGNSVAANPQKDYIP